MRIKIFTFLLLTLACMQLQAAGYGFVSFNQNNGNFLYTTYKVRKNDTVIVQFPDANGVSVCLKLISAL